MKPRHPNTATRQAKLSPERKRKFILMLQEGYSQLDSCEALGITVGNVLHERDIDANFDSKCVNAWRSILFNAEKSFIELIKEGYWPAVKYFLEAKTRTEKDENKRWHAGTDIRDTDFGAPKRALGDMISVMSANMEHYTPERMLEMERSCAGEYAAALEANGKLFSCMPPINLKDVDRGNNTPKDDRSAAEDTHTAKSD